MVERIPDGILVAPGIREPDPVHVPVAEYMRIRRQQTALVTVSDLLDELDGVAHQVRAALEIGDPTRIGLLVQNVRAAMGQQRTDLKLYGSAYPTASIEEAAVKALQGEVFL